MKHDCIISNRPGSFHVGITSFILQLKKLITVESSHLLIILKLPSHWTETTYVCQNLYLSERDWVLRTTEPSPCAVCNSFLSQKYLLCLGNFTQGMLLLFLKACNHWLGISPALPVPVPGADADWSQKRSESRPVKSRHVTKDGALFETVVFVAWFVMSP